VNNTERQQGEVSVLFLRTLFIHLLIAARDFATKLKEKNVPSLVVLAVDGESGTRKLLGVETVRADLRGVLA